MPHWREVIKLLTADDISKLIQISKSKIYKWIHYNYIPHLNIGSEVRFDSRRLHEIVIIVFMLNFIFGFSCHLTNYSLPLYLDIDLTIK